MVKASGPGHTRALARRPRVVLLDLFETVLRVDTMRRRFVDVGRPEHECELFMAYALRDGLAFALSGTPTSFGRVARDAMRAATGYKLSDEALEHLLEGMLTLATYPDAEVALATLAQARIPVWLIVQGSGKTTLGALDYNALRTFLRGVFTTDEMGLMIPDPEAYLHCCRKMRSDPARTAFLSSHAWAVHGAAKAGLVTGLAMRSKGGAPTTMELPHVTADRLDHVVDRLLQLPS